MGLEKFSPDETIFQDENVLRDSYTPDQLVCRDDELAQYQSALRPVINGAQPKNIFLYGDAGLGKTLATELVLDRLRTDQEDYDHLDLHTVSLVCKTLSSSYQVAAHLVNEFRPPEEQIKATGYPAGMVYNMLWDHLNDLDATHCLIVLDEVDSIGKDDDILYELPRCNDNGNVDDTLVGVIGISNNFTFRDNLSARVKDSLCDDEIHFPPYDANQLRQILQQRAEKAFHENVLEGDVIPLCAAFAGQKYGSARQALKRLYKSGDLARDENDSMVRESHVRAADRIVEKDKIMAELSQIPTQEKLTLYGLLKLDEQDRTPAKRSHVYEKYTIAAKRVDAQVVSDRTVHDSLSKLTLKGFLDVNEKNEGPHGGSYYEYSFSIRPDLAREVLSEDSRLASLEE
ncbi:orc1/cdc6 family replication initiation protein [Haladaptatus sp. AB618]|uniref:Cdc6/Cdc18 family protein n=1 Tax=Haladaptatus sp. AB618 TaxID=2934173 RepID=UPI00209BF2C3|nr:orc1/cdc6 family replication initiation protein [Haladaptatus sp. AB618]MCO8256767.1 orc1/cdc6 family replication initiation protein [Haladaptatus sp. AB618]